MHKQIQIAVIGVGNRARKYLSCLPEWVQVKYVVDPEPLRLQIASRICGVPQEACFEDPEVFFATKPKAQAAIIATPDRLHLPLSLLAANHGWHILLEKPVSISEGAYLQLIAATEQYGVHITPCLEMRFHKYFRRIRNLVKSGAVGDILSIDHTEHVGPDRMAHTFVRGLWSRRDQAGPIFLSKCCHDADFIVWLTGQTALWVNSTGRIDKFKPTPGTPERCLGCPISDCPYSAVKLYKERREWIDGFDVPDGGTLDEVIDEELRSGRWGRCVYHCDNDVYDTQDVSVELTGGIHLDMHLDGTSMKEGRTTIINGSQGTLVADKWQIRIVKDGETVLEEDYSGLEAIGLHGGADAAMLEDFFEAVATGGTPSLTLQSALEGHRICYLAG
ncbi:MAG: Gfo/Idh/MocA family oxidoreductase [Bacteroidales bacterium]|nr:Gfo/Idh/MocA family oxidoreductase [Bacteroidales bacterium]